MSFHVHSSVMSTDSEAGISGPKATGNPSGNNQAELAPSPKVGLMYNIRTPKSPVLGYPLLAVLLSQVTLLGVLPGCAPSEPAAQSGSSGQQPPQMPLATIGALVPKNMLTNDVVAWTALAPDELSNLLAQRMPLVNPGNRSLPVEEVIMRAFKKRLVYLPPRPPMDDPRDTWGYERELEPWISRGKMPTLGEFLLAHLTANNEVGDAMTRLGDAHFRRNGREPAPSDDIRPLTGHPMDVIIATQEHIAVIAVPSR